MHNGALKRVLTAIIVVVTVLTLAGCGFAQYTKVPVKVVDNQTGSGIAGVTLRTYYLKPMLDPSHQHKDKRKTDGGGFARLTVATNQSQWTIFGRTHGIFPCISAEAAGYYRFQGEIDWFIRDPRQTKPLIIRMEKRAIGTNNAGAVNGSFDK